MRNIYLIPGYKHTLETPGYRKLILSLEKLWYNVEFIPISWKYHVMSEYIQEANNKIRTSPNDVILGFSFGAMIALNLAERHSFRQVVLCSLSPYFSEDIPKLPLKYKLYLGVRRWTDFIKHHSEVNVRNPLLNQYTFIYGSAETSRLQQRNKKMIEKLRVDTYDIVEWVGHDVGDPRYQEVILKFL